MGVGAEFRGVSYTVTKTASYTLTLAELGTTVRMNVASANTITIPNDTNLATAVGAWFNWRQVGDGATTLVADTGVTLNLGASGGLTAVGKGAAGTCQKVAANTWDVYGELQ